VKYFFKTIVLTFLFVTSYYTSFTQYTAQDTLRGSIGPGRQWWDVKYYDISITPDFEAKTIQGKNNIRFEWLNVKDVSGYMQIDLQQPMIIDSVIYRQKSLSFDRNGNAWMISFPAMTGHSQLNDITIYFHGQPRIAVTPPWDGGWIWTKDEKGRTWATVACQGLGASVWYPCKDHQSDEPDSGASLTVTVPDSLVVVGNGRLKNKTQANNGTTTWQWEVKNPINNYDIVPYIGYYVNWQQEYAGEKGNLDCNYWVMDYNLEKSKQQFPPNVIPMLKCFENWFGPYPFYEDGYKLVETPHLGMEHQSGIAYGNRYRNGYLGTDLSGTGWGTKWDYIVVHESGHEWFGNNITTKDVADMWVHEGFTDYSETLFIECQYGKEAGNEYLQGIRSQIQNNSPIIGPYGVNKEGSADMYFKGANLIHTIRQIIGNDDTFKKILRGLNQDFYHQTVTTQVVEKYISQKSGKDLSKIFDQYLRTKNVPVLEYRVKNKTVSFRWSNCIKGFTMPVLVSVGSKKQWLKPTETFQTIKSDGTAFSPDKNFYILAKEIK
jgi:aminopeptidase N